jgi:hypothetical protein
MNDTGFWRVYREEWTVAHVSDADGDSGHLECDAKMSGADDQLSWRIVPWSETEPGRWPWMLEVHLPVMKGEFTTPEGAESYAAAIGGTVAAEGSAEDKEFQRRQSVLTK